MINTPMDVTVFIGLAILFSLTGLLVFVSAFNRDNDDFVMMFGASIALWIVSVFLVALTGLTYFVQHFDVVAK